MICSSLNRLPFIRPSPLRDGLYFKSRVFQGCRPAGIVALKTLSAIRNQVGVSREALTKLEKPFVSIGELTPFVKQSSGEPYARPWLNYNLRNDGRSVAQLVTVVGIVRIYSEQSRMPPYPDYSGALVDKSIFFIGPNSNSGTFRWTAQLPRKLSADEYPAIRDETAQLIFFGYVRYLDTFGKLHKTGFGWRYNPPNNGMFLIGGEMYNYNRVESEESGRSC